MVRPQQQHVRVASIHITEALKEMEECSIALKGSMDYVLVVVQEFQGSYAHKTGISDGIRLDELHFRYGETSTAACTSSLGTHHRSFERNGRSVALLSKDQYKLHDD